MPIDVEDQRRQAVQFFWVEINEKDWREIVRMAITQAKGGDGIAREWLLQCMLIEAPGFSGDGT